MKKRILSTLLATVLCISLLPMAVSAEPVKLGSVDITIELPKGGDYFDWSAAPTVTSFTSSGIDLLANGAGILTTYWNGDYDTDEYGTPYFRNGGSYTLTLKLMFGSGYCANGTTAFTGETVAMPETFSATVNGVAATVTRNTSTYYPEITVTLKLEGEVFNTEQKTERDKEWDDIRKARRSTYTPRTWQEAETYNRDNMPEKVVVVTDPEGRDLMENRENMTTVIFNVSTADKMAADVANADYLKEIWLSPEVDPYKFTSNLRQAQRNGTGGYWYWENSAAIPLYLSTGTVFIPESRVSEFKQTIDDKDFLGYTGGALTIKCYAGDDVIAAQKAGASAAKEICTEHKYDTPIRSADRICHFADHDDHDLYYYSCGYCGKCEYNPNHVEHNIEMVNLGYINFDGYKAIQRHGTVYGELPADAVYVGVNAAGEHVWWNACPLCGITSTPYEFNTYDQLNTTGADCPFEEWKAQMIAGLKGLEEQALNSIDRYYPGTFSLPLKSDAYISAWAQSDVNLALNDNLLDTALLGGDYTQNITRLQFCSVAVKLAEELIGRELTPAANIFTDTDNLYVLKAYGAGITSGTGNGTFSPNATLTRQEMATFLYRTLRYIEQNSDYSYTDYTSKLSNYSDSRSVQSWATEAMAFMNALDLVKGTTDTTLDPNGTCTIEQAVSVADRSVYAHLIGWYQVNPKKNMSPTSELGKGKMGGFYLREGSYVWVTGRRYGVKVYTYDERHDLDSLYVPIINPFNGQAAEMKYGDLVPVRN